MSAPVPQDPGAPLRIAYLTYRGKPHVGGQGVYTRHLTKALTDLGHHVEVFVRPAVPDPRRPGEAHQAAQPRHVQRPLPRAVPGVLGVQDARGRARDGAVLHGHVPRAAGLQLPGVARADARAVPSSTSSTTTSASATGSSPSRSASRRSSRCTTRSRRTANWRWPTRRTGASVGRSVGGTRSSRCRGGSPPGCRAIVVVSESSIRDIHDDMGVAYERMRLVPGRRRSRAVPAADRTSPGSPAG